VAPEDAPLRFVVITPDDEFYSRLQQIAASCEWHIERTRSIVEAETLVRPEATPMVVYERDPEHPDWRGALRRLSEFPAQPCILLASPVADDYLWQEVIRNHGYDILPKSAPPEKIIHCLKFAWFWAVTKGKPGLQ
jgi:hypothetical protein